MMKISRSICIVFVGLLLFAFQNCSDVEFANVDSATKGTAAPTIPEVVEGLENGEIEEPDGIVDADPDDPDYVYEDDPVDENYPTDEDTNNGEYADEGGEPLDLDNYACQAIRMKCSDISTFGRNTQGVRLININAGERVTGVAVLDKEDDDEE